MKVFEDFSKAVAFKIAQNGGFCCSLANESPPAIPWRRCYFPCYTRSFHSPTHLAACCRRCRYCFCVTETILLLNVSYSSCGGKRKHYKLHVIDKYEETFKNNLVWEEVTSTINNSFSPTASSLEYHCVN